MKSPNQRNFSSMEKKVTLASGSNIMKPMTVSRATPSKKTTVVIYPKFGGGKV